MLTRCPACATHFRVTAEQLKLRAGRVRCGECQHVFSALDTLIEEPALVIAPLAPSAPEPATALAGEEEIAVPPAPTLESADLPAAVADRAPGELEESVADTPADAPAAPEAEGPALELQPESGPATRDDDAPVEPISNPPAAEAEFRQNDPPDETADWDDSYVEPPPPRRWPWAIGGVLAMLTLGLQATLAYRVELAVLWPDTRPLLAAACDALGCELTLPAKVALVGIESSDLHPDTTQKGRLALTATLKNRAPFAQQFPHLELTLTDTADKAIARKVLGPDQYLPRGTAIAAGMQANADLTVAVALDAGELPASGYRLYIFYP